MHYSNSEKERRKESKENAVTAWLSEPLFEAYKTPLWSDAWGEEGRKGRGLQSRPEGGEAASSYREAVEEWEKGLTEWQKGRKSRQTFENQAYHQAAGRQWMPVCVENTSASVTSGRPSLANHWNNWYACSLIQQTPGFANIEHSSYIIEPLF